MRVLTTEEEAFYGYLAAVNSTTLSDGVALDIGGGSMQLTLVKDREARDMRSWPFGAVRMTERFLARETVKPKHLKALREHVGAALERRALARRKGGELAGIGGTVRNLGDRRDAARGAARVRRPGLPAAQGRARRDGRRLRRDVRRPSAARSPASSPSAAT